MTTNYTTAQGVQQFSITIAGTKATGTATINSVGSGAFILWNGFNPSTANAPNKDFAYLSLTNATTITATRNTTGGTVVVNGCIIDGDTSNLIKSVQYGTVTIAANATSATASISTVTNTNAAVHLLGWSSANATYNGPFENPIVSLSGTTVTASISDTTNTGAGIVVGFVVIEFQGSALNQSVQQLSATSSSSVTSFTHAVTSVNTSNAICLYGGSSIASVATDFAEIKQYGSLTNSTVFTVNVNTAIADSKTYNVTVVEFISGLLNSAVQRGTTTLTGVTSASTAIRTINESYAAISWLGNSSNTTATDVNRAEGAATFGTAGTYIINDGAIQGSSVSSKSLTISATASGSLIVVGLGGFGTSGITVTGVTDNQSQVYTQAPSAQGSFSNGFSDIWYFPNTVSGVTSITVTLSAAVSTLNFVYYEVGNIALTSPVDASNSVSNGVATNAPVGPSITTTGNGDFIFVFMGLDGNILNSVSSPYTNSANNEAWLIPATTVTASQATYHTSASDPFCGSAVAFLATTSQGVSVTKNTATGNIVGGWEIPEFQPFVPQASTVIYISDWFG